MDRAARFTLFRHGVDGFFAGATWLAGVNPGMQLVVQAAAALTRLVVGQAEARWRAVLDAPIGASTAGVEAPSQRVIRWHFERRKRWPGMAEAFAPELAADDREALQAAYRILYELLVLDRPALRAVFADEIARRDWRAIVDQWDTARAILAHLGADPQFRNGLSHLWSLLVQDGPEASEAEARAAFVTHWHGLRDVALEAVS